MPVLLCPNCQTGMQEVNRSDVMIDICPQCRGVWLDRGELEKLLGELRSAKEETFGQEQPYVRGASERERYPEERNYQAGRENYPREKPEHRSEYGDQGKYSRHGEPRRKKSIFEKFENIFD